MKTNLPTPPRLTENERNVLAWAFNLVHSTVAGGYKLPQPMCYAINMLQDAVHDLAKERGVSIKDLCSKEYLAFNEGYWAAVEEKFTERQSNDDKT